MSEIRELSRWLSEARETVTESLEECETMKSTGPSWPTHSNGMDESWRIMYLEWRMYGINIECLKSKVREISRSERIVQVDSLSLYSSLFTLLKLYARLEFALTQLKQQLPFPCKDDTVDTAEESSIVKVHRKLWDRKALLERTIKVAQRDITQAGKYRLESADGRVEMELYCRIVGSTVMIRVGGGWEDVSDFLKNWRARSSPLYSTRSSHLPIKKSRSMECMSDMGGLGCLRWSRIEDD